MKLPVLGFIALLPAVGMVSAGHAQGENAAPSTKESLAAVAADLKAFAAGVAAVERELAEATGVSREDALVMYGRSSAASGRFDRAAAACAMFLNEFGLWHPYSEQVATRFADCLFPFRFDEVNVVHVSSGPRLDPVWRMGYLPQAEHLQQAVAAFELAASIARDQGVKGSALLKLGWVHRVLGDWSASTAAWDRCAGDAALAKSAADGLWLAAENLEWTSRPAEAAERLQRLAREYPDDARTAAAIERIEDLEAEARRSADWPIDPVASLMAEIETRASARSPYEVYRSAVRWLQRRGERGAIIAVSRWACGWYDWPVEERIASRYDLADALLQGGDEEARSEAARCLGEIVEITPDLASAVPAGLRCCRVLDGLGRFTEAEVVLKGLADRVRGSARWEPVVLSEYSDWLVKHGRKERAADVLNTLARSHPDFDLAERLEALWTAGRKGGGR